MTDLVKLVEQHLGASVPAHAQPWLRAHIDPCSAVTHAPIDQLLWFSRVVASRLATAESNALLIACSRAERIEQQIRDGTFDPEAARSEGHDRAVSVLCKRAESLFRIKYHEFRCEQASVDQFVVEAIARENRELVIENNAKKIRSQAHHTLRRALRGTSWWKSFRAAWVADYTRGLGSVRYYVRSSGADHLKEGCRVGPSLAVRQLMPDAICDEHEFVDADYLYMIDHVVSGHGLGVVADASDAFRIALEFATLDPAGLSTLELDDPDDFGATRDEQDPLRSLDDRTLQVVPKGDAWSWPARPPADLAHQIASA